VLFGISRVLPGMNLLSLTVLLGHRFHGLLGALAALSGLTVPCFLVIVAGCALVSGDRPNPYLQGIVRGLTPTAAALLLHTGWQLSRSALQKQEALARGYWLLVAGAGAVASVDGRVHPAWIVLAGALTGILLARPILGRDR